MATLYADAFGENVWINAGGLVFHLLYEDDKQLRLRVYHAETKEEVIVDMPLEGEVRVRIEPSEFCVKVYDQ